MKKQDGKTITFKAMAKSVCVGGRLIENYSPKNFTEVKAEIDKWIDVDKSKSIITMRGEYTLNYQGFIYLN